MKSGLSDKPSLDTPFWRSTRKLTAVVLLVWAVLVGTVVILAPGLQVSVFGVPMGYWLITSFLLPSFLGLVAFYAWRMDRLESATMNNSNECLNEPDAYKQNESAGRSGGDTHHENQPKRAR